MTTKNQADAMLTALQTIATAVQDGTLELTNWRSERTTGEVDSDRAPLLLDYLVIRDLLGRGDPKAPRTFGAQRTPAVPPTSSTASSGSKPTTPSLLTFPELPSGGTQVAVFTQPDKPAETVDLAKPHGGTTDTFELRAVMDDVPIVRMELQRADGYPIALGPRLKAAV